MSELTLEEKREWVSLAKGYLGSAKIIVDSDKPSTLTIAPVLHLLCHGIELTLKLNLRNHGVSVQELTNIRHDLSKLWNHSKSSEFKIKIHSFATTAWNVARNSGKYPDDNFDENPIAILDDYIITLSHLHTNKSKFALRYATTTNEKIPEPPFLLDVFIPVIEIFVDQIKLGK